MAIRPQGLRSDCETRSMVGGGESWNRLQVEPASSENHARNDVC